MHMNILFNCSKLELIDDNNSRLYLAPQLRNIMNY